VPRSPRPDRVPTVDPRTLVLPEGDYGVPVGQVSTCAFRATNTAAGQRAGRLVTTAYSVAPCAVMVPPESPVRGPADLAGVPAPYDEAILA